MSPDYFTSAVKLLSGEDGEAGTAAEIAQRGVTALEKLAVHLARVVGTQGSLTVFRRAVALSSAKFPWLPYARINSGERTDAAPFESLRVVLAVETPDVAMDAFVVILSSYINLLGRLIGDELVLRLLHEVWPTIFAQDKKEPT